MRRDKEYLSALNRYHNGESPEGLMDDGERGGSECRFCGSIGNWDTRRERSGRVVHCCQWCGMYMHRAHRSCENETRRQRERRLDRQRRYNAAWKARVCGANPL